MGYSFTDLTSSQDRVSLPGNYVLSPTPSESNPVVLTDTAFSAAPMYLLYSATPAVLAPVFQSS